MAEKVDLEQVRFLAESGKSCREVSLELGITIRQTQHAVHERLKLKYEMPAAERKRLRQRKVLALHKEGLSCREISVRTRVHMRTINRDLYDLGVSQPRKTPIIRLSDVKRMKGLVAEGYSLQAISQITGHGRETIHRYTGYRGLTPQEAGRAARMIRSLNEVDKRKRSA